MKPVEEIALMLLVGFVRCWTMRQVIDAVGAGGEDPSDLHAHAPFISSELWHRKTPVRAYVAQQWPAFAAWLIRKEKDPEALRRVIPEVMKLCAKAEVRGKRLTRQERYDLAHTHDVYRATAIGKASKKAKHYSHLRRAWGVVKR